MFGALEYGRGVQRTRQGPVIEAYKKDIDRTLIRENLKLPVEERLRKEQGLARFALAMRRAGRQVRHREA
jgi:hypothetical protein